MGGFLLRLSPAYMLFEKISHHNKDKTLRKTKWRKHENYYFKCKNMDKIILIQKYHFCKLEIMYKGVNTSYSPWIKADIYKHIGIIL